MTMPSIKEMCIPTTTTNSSSSSSKETSSPTQSAEFLSKDMENLVSEIKENLKLTNFKVKHQRKLNRSKPYNIPSRSWNESECSLCSSSCSTTKCSHRPSSSLSSNKIKETTDNPYELLQELLKDGSLIKEAVRRLQKGLSSKQRYFYESDDDSRSSPHPNLDFVC